MAKLTKDNCLFDVHPDLCKEWNYKKNFPLAPQQCFRGSTVKVWWICSKKHEWQASINSRTNKNHTEDCPYCANQRVDKSNCLATLNPQLASEWHPTKNGKLTPYDVVYGGRRKVWWRCNECHYEWKANVYSRKIGEKKCKRCNSLGANNAKLVKEWHPTKNGKLTPYDVNKCSRQKVWWNCSKGHIWEVSISSRVGSDNGCPYCSNHKINKENCLSTLNPFLAKEWNYRKNKDLSPYGVSVNSHKKVWWKCSLCGNEWLATVKSRNQGRFCPNHFNGFRLKDGTFCHSLIEAFYYLKFKKEKKIFKFNKRYPDMNCSYRYDFYLPKENRYIEVTSYDKDNWPPWFHKPWKCYSQKIDTKRKHVENVLKSNFTFIQRVLTYREKCMVKSNIIQNKRQ